MVEYLNWGCVPDTTVRRTKENAADGVAGADGSARADVSAKATAVTRTGAVTPAGAVTGAVGWAAAQPPRAMMQIATASAASFFTKTS